MSTVDEKSIKVIEFSGKDFKIWSRKFCARAIRKGYFTLLRGTQAIPTLNQYIAAEEDPSNATNKITINLWKLNKLAFEDIILSINHTTNQGKTAFHLVDNSITTEQSDGNCRIACEKVTQKYLPKTAPSYIKLKKEFANSTLGDASTPPDEWLSELESLRNQMNAITIPNKSDMIEVDLIIHILSNLPEEYEVAVAELEKDMQSQSTPIKMEDVRRVLDSRFERFSKKVDSLEEDKPFVSWTKKQYKGICGKCGEYGHSSSNCTKNSTNNNNNRFKSQNNNSSNNRSSGSNNNTSRPRPGSTKICNSCGAYGHHSKYCRAKKACERFLNDSKERGNAAIDELEEENYIEETEEDFQSDDESVAEVGFIATATESTDQKEKALACVIDGVTHPSFTSSTMFGDSRSSCHIRNTMEGVFDVETINEQIGGVGNNICTTRKGKLRANILQADGTKKTKVLSPVKYSKDAQENLLTITAEMSAGAKLSSNPKKIYN